MKRILTISVLILIVAACSKEPRYVINGKIDGADSITFLLQKREAGRMVTIDSVMALKGSFKMKGGAVRYPEMVLLTAMDTRLRTSFYLENSEITITGKLDSLYAAKITGSKSHDEYNGLIESSKVLNDKYTSLYNEYQLASQKGDTATASRLEKEAVSLEKEMTTLQKDFIRNNPSSFVAPSILTSLSYEMEGDEIESFITAMDTAVANTDMIKDLKERVVRMKSVAIGQKAPDFTLNDPEGNPVSLYSKLGPKLLLVDFWAAWCGPCRRENPNVVRVYNEFNKKGFDVFGVSLDQKKDDWVRAISDDKLTWTHVSDLQYWNSAAAALYAVNSIPANFLLDENGVIIGKNLREEALYEKVRELLSK
ncbi:MAG: TlpA disulfide reductase family protein [Bacteroidales bacterium]|jgi:peroxiredoxin|nr:TlpA disulfide reductase family protein [Bacteroidales bacterium]